MLIFYAYTPHDMETFNQNSSKIGSNPDDTDPRSTRDDRLDDPRIDLLELSAMLWGLLGALGAFYMKET